jgi:hypothetical protein
MQWECRVSQKSAFAARFALAALIVLFLMVFLLGCQLNTLEFRAPQARLDAKRATFEKP